MKNINFTHDYYKLYDNEFTTIRGESWFKKFKLGEEVEIINSATGDYFYAIVTLLCRGKIKYLPYQLVRKDIEYPGFICEVPGYLNKLIELMNSHSARARFSHLKARYDTSVTVIYLRRFEKDE